MAEPFKDLINPDTVARLADQLHEGTPGFPRDAFHAAAVPALPGLELKERVRHVARTLRAHLPEPWPHALDVVLAGAGDPLPDAESVGSRFHEWPLLQLVEDFGLDHPEASLSALRELTRRFSAEFAVRPYLIHHPERAWSAVTAWSQDPDVHVRRLASEGTRPRLPWGQQLPASLADPSRGLHILERLRDDPERYVQRSVANHLNDIAKDHPDTVIRVATEWSVDAPSDRAWTVKHGLRTLLKAGDARALALIGIHRPEVHVTRLAATPATVRIGDATTVQAELTSTATSPQDLRVDLIVYFVRQRGKTGPKVFRGPTRTLEPGATWPFSKALSFKPVSTRRLYPGVHRIALQVNGQVVGETSIDLGP